MRLTCERRTNKTGKGFLNSLINKLPFEVHVPGYQFCGPGTNLKKRLIRGDKGINPLDSACKEHDIAYSNSNNLEDRHKADKILENRAWERVKSKDSSNKEKIVAFSVASAMKGKRKIGMGLKQKRKSEKKKNNLLGGKKKNKNSKKSGIRMVMTPNHTGGVLPLMPIFAGLSALGSLASGGASIYNAYNNAKKKGKGLYLNPVTGKGLYSNSKISNYRRKKMNKKKKKN